MMKRQLRGKVCSHDIGDLFVYHGKNANHAWWCSICDSDLFQEKDPEAEDGIYRTLDYHNPRKNK